MAVGLDCGTSYFIAAHTDKLIKKEHNAFLRLEEDPKILKRQLSRMNIPYVQLNGKIYIVGKNAFEYAQIFGTKNLRRPMKDGLLNPAERDALPILKAIVKDLLGDPKKPNEICVYCVPAPPIDSEALVDYHEDVLGQIIESLGFKPVAIKEAVALAYHGLVDDDLSGIVLSIGGGMCNTAILYAGLDAINFSVRRGGVWIDQHVSLDTGVPIAKVQFIKESGELDLSSAKVVFSGNTPKIDQYIPKSNIHQALRSYYGVLISYILTNLAKQFNESSNMPNFPKPVPMIIGGGSAMVPGFIDLFKEQLENIDFPIAISDVRLATNPHEAVALGCLSEAILTEED
jgi:hypothetical protein